MAELAPFYSVDIPVAENDDPGVLSVVGFRIRVAVVFVATDFDEFSSRSGTLRLPKYREWLGMCVFRSHAPLMVADRDSAGG